MPLTTVFQTFSPVEAQLIRSMLEAASIPAFVTHELSALTTEGYSLTTGGIGVQVPADCVNEARALIEARGPAAV